MGTAPRGRECTYFHRPVEGLQRVGVARAPERGQASAQAIHCPRADAILEAPDYGSVVGKCDEAVRGVERETRRHLLWEPSSLQSESFVTRKSRNCRKNIGAQTISATSRVRCCTMNTHRFSKVADQLHVVLPDTAARVNDEPEVDFRVADCGTARGR
jgi:hypothetical protein